MQTYMGDPDALVLGRDPFNQPILVNPKDPKFVPDYNLMETLNGQASVFISSQDLLSACEAREELACIQTTRGLAGFLKNFDLRPQPDPTRKFRGYDITREWVKEWGDRYGTRTEGPQ